VATVRPARAEDLPVLREIERRAEEPFRALGMDAVADDEPPSEEELARYQRAGRAWVAVDADHVVAYLLLGVVDGTAHVEQVSVDPSHARQGLGRRLVDTAADWARRQGLPALTLTTFEQVPWNAPYYARLGFEVVPEGSLSPGLRAVRDHERARGLDRWPRVVMQRAV
jgi:GNAT superfamily N-acetyltransferase